MNKILIATLIGFILIFGCVSIDKENKNYYNEKNEQLNNNKQEQKILVVVSIPPQKEFVKAIGGDNVETILLVPPGASPHTYEPTSQQLAQISKADIYFAVGSFIEVEKIWLSKIKDINPHIRIINTSKNIDFIQTQTHEHEEQNEHLFKDEDALIHVENEYGEQEQLLTSFDPHVWTSINNAKKMVEEIKAALIEQDPQNSKVYMQNAHEYTQKLETLDEELRSDFGSNQKKSFFVYHPAWGYFANDYGLTQVCIEKLGKEPTPVELAQIIAEAKEQNVKIIFASLQFSAESANTISQQIGGKVIIIDPLDENYIQNMQNVSEKIKDAIISQ